MYYIYRFIWRDCCRLGGGLTGYNPIKYGEMGSLSGYNPIKYGEMGSLSGYNPTNY